MRALVTGAGSADGIGFAAARTLLERGASVLISSTTARIHERAEELGAEGYVADLIDWEQARGLAEAAGPVDVLTSGLALELAPHVTVNSVPPGWIATGQSIVIDGGNTLQELKLG